MVTSARTRLTYQDYANTPDDERYELIDGELIMVPGPNMPHQDNQRDLGFYLVEFVKRNDLGKIYYSDTDVVLSDTEVVKPDLLFVAKEREGIITFANIQGAPDLVVEILSPSTSRRDWIDKRELYARYGVKEYWIADPANKIVWRLTLKGGMLEIEQTYYEGDTIASSVLEGFSVAVNDIF